MTRLLLSIVLLTASLKTMEAQKPERIKAVSIQNRLKQSDTLYVVNFWATWCGPCVAELPEFNRLDSAWHGKPVKIVLVSLDFPEAWPVKLAEFIQKKKISPEVLWLDEKDANYFIPLISEKWNGSIPATLFSCGATHTQEFHEGKADFAFLNEKVKAFIKHP
ncbi:MAG TPA: TlpA disulfide reductase family protein [Bacteroidia bacterium]|jgi:thiol-disulfide isomerase/thioredoxin|nr:TlpA disulfide reductase family protein [Bacteroidia bacterium]